MNEDRLSSLLKEFASPIVATNVRPAPVRSGLRLRFGLAGLGLATALAIGFAVLPGQSDAAALHRMEVAISNAKSMTVTISVTDAKGRNKVYNRIWYRQGRWRSDNYPGLPIAKTFIVRDGEQFVYTPKHHTLTKEPAGPWTGDPGKKTALDFAMAQTNLGEVSEERTLSIEPHDPVDGRAAYELVLVRAADNYRCEILVDKATDLPIRTSTKFDFMGNADRSTELHDFRFDEPISPETFDPKALGLPIQDLLAQQADLLDKWRRPIAVMGQCQIRDVWQNEEGDVYVAYSHPKGAGQTERPDRVEDANGSGYLFVNDIGPGEIRGDTGVRDTFRYEGLDTRISVWTPLERPAPLPRELSVGCSLASDPTKPGPHKSTANRPNSDQDRLLRVSTEPSASRLPPYSTTLVLNDYGDQLVIQIATVRAEWYRKNKDYERELPCRQEAYERAREWLPSMAEREYKPLIENCLQALGRAKP